MDLRAALTAHRLLGLHARAVHADAEEFTP
jgi:hypothetical protein